MCSAKDDSTVQPKYISYMYMNVAGINAIKDVTVVFLGTTYLEAQDTIIAICLIALYWLFIFVTNTSYLIVVSVL